MRDPETVLEDENYVLKMDIEHLEKRVKYLENYILTLRPYCNNCDNELIDDLCDGCNRKAFYVATQADKRGGNMKEVTGESRIGLFKDIIEEFSQKEMRDAVTSVFFASLFSDMQRSARELEQFIQYMKQNMDKKLIEEYKQEYPHFFDRGNMSEYLN